MIKLNIMLFRNQLMNSLFTISLIFISVLQISCQPSNRDQIQELCDSYNRKSPIKFDEWTTLKGASCVDGMFGFNYELEMDLSLIHI